VPAVDTWAATTPTYTLATFNDPSTSWDQPLFHLHFDALDELISIDGGWAGPGLTLQVPFDNSTYTNATFSMDPVGVSNGILDPGHVVFKDNLGAPIMGITWGSGSVNDFGLGARNKFAYSTNVDITYEGYPFTLESFAFAFTNYTDIDDNTATVTASFTSAVAPEPVSLAILWLGGTMVALRRSRR
jgi:hypothetical protein